MTSVSVIIPVFNAAATVAEAIASVRAQQWPGTEIVVVDDGSTDGTTAVLRGLVGPDLRVFTQANAGPAAARNFGIGAASGAWIAFLDADDLWLDGKLAAQFDLVARRPDVELVWGGVIVREADGSEAPWPSYVPREHLFLGLLTGNHLATPTILVRRDRVLEAGSFDARLRTGEDWDLWLRLAVACECAGVDEAVCVVRRSSARKKYTMRNFEESWPIVLDKAFELPAARKRWPDLESRRARLTAWHYSVLAKSHLHRGGLVGFARWAARCIRADTAGARFLLPGAGRLRPIE